MRLIDANKIIEIYQSCADMFSDEELDGVETVISWIKEAPIVCDMEQMKAEITELFKASGVSNSSLCFAVLQIIDKVHKV